MAAADKTDANRDPFSNEPGAHPVGTGLGAVAGGAAVGAAVGTVGGPVGMTLGGIAGAVTGGLAGKAVAEAVNPTAEEAYWRSAYTSEPYYERDLAYEEYHPAYALGWAGLGLYGGAFDAVEPRLSTEWDRVRGTSTLDWGQARPAARAAWERASRSVDRDAAVRDNGDTVSTLNDLLESCRDGEFGFRASAEQAASQDIKTILMRHSSECAQAGRELEQEVLRLGGKPADGGTAAGALHRGWVAIRTALTKYDDKAVLDECERGEDTAVARYRKALKQDLPADVRTLVQRQADGAQRNHDQVKALRDAYRKA